MFFTTGISLALASVFQIACGEKDEAPTCDEQTGSRNESRGGVSVVNDECTLAKEVDYREKEIPIDETKGQMAQQGLAPAKIIPFSLTLKATVTPPTLDGNTLQATSIVIDNNRALISYNVQGEPRLGAVDVIDLTNREKPLLKARALFSDADINNVNHYSGQMYVVGATADESLTNPAFVQKITLNGNNISLDGTIRVGLTSYAGTGVTASGSVYATSGNTGGLTILNSSTLVQTKSFDLPDARWVDVGAGKVVVVSGTPGKLTVLNEASQAVENSFSFSGADIAESKSTVAISGGKAFIAAGTAGVQVLSISTGKIVATVSRPDPASVGLSSSVVVTNSVAVDRDLLFIGNGEAGVYVAQGATDFATSSSEAAQTITVLGQLILGANQSVNHVALKDDYLMIATGVGGLKVVKVNGI